MGSQRLITWNLDGDDTDSLYPILYLILQSYSKLHDLDEAEPDDEVRPWLQGFVRLVGLETALKVLEGVGVLEEKG